jgi:pimeloyl-ACP methyl ester carboxylesterase
MNRKIKHSKQMITVMAAITLGVLLLITSILLLASPGKPKPYLNENGNTLPGSISEKVFVTINGAQQGMFIKSKNKAHPVLLYLHGGIPDYFLTKKHPTGLEDYFTVVWWEQPGLGLSYNANISPGANKLEQMISDTKEVTHYLRKRFGQEKIYLMGRSGGTFLGMHVASRAPELYHAYIGVAQITDQLKSESLAYEYMLKQFKEKGNEKMVRKLESAPVTMANGISDSYYAVRDDAMHSLGVGTMRDMRSIVTGMFLPSLTCRDYTLIERVNIWRGKIRSGVSVLWDTILATDMTQQVPEVKIPVYFFHGVYDYTVNFSLAKDYFEKLKAPLKGFYTFEHSAHSPLFEEPKKMQEILREDVLAGRNNLADIK